MQIDWAVFGELDKGHALLASSGNPGFAAKLTMLTDRPGDPPVGLNWGPVISGFPVADHYVFLRTQPDPTVGRAGMVRSYAAYSPLTTVGELNNLLLIFSHLPGGLGKSTASISPLQIEDEALAAKPDPREATGRVAVARLLCAPDTKLPLIWASAEPYLPTVATLWAQLPASLRASFAFMFQFAPEYRTPVNPTVVATLPELVGRWPASQLVHPEQTGPDGLTSAQKWFAGSTDGVPFGQVLHDYAIHVPQFAKLNLVSSFADLVTRLPALSFDQARRAVNIAAIYSRVTTVSTGKRSDLFARLCALVRHATPEELRKLRNLEDAALPELIPPLQEAMENWIADAATALAEEHVDLLELAAAEPDNWWSAPFIQWLKRRAATLDHADGAFLVEIAASKPLLDIVANALPATAAGEDCIMGGLTNELAAPQADNLLGLAEKRGWVRLHAACLLRSYSADEAIVRHSSVAGLAEGGFNILNENLGFEALARAACENGAPALVRFTGRLLGRDSAAHLSSLPAGGAHRLRVLQAAVDAASAPLDSELRRTVVDALDHAPANAGLSDLCTVCVTRSTGLFLELREPTALLARLSKAQRDEIVGALERHIQHEVQAGRAFRFSNPKAFAKLVDGDDIVAWLAEVPASDAAHAGVNAFQCCPFLTDADCRNWLIELFTRTQRQPLGPGAATVIGGLLAAVDFPESARVVRETMEHFYRADIAPIHNQIRYRYQMARALERDPYKQPSRLPKVLIATALTLERGEVLKHLPSAEYDDSLHADVALWPLGNPVFEVYLTTTGMGNLGVQGVVLDLLNAGVTPALAFFVGVCGAVKDNDFADVVYGTKVCYVEGGKEEEGGVKSRPELGDTAPALAQLAHRVAEKAWQPPERDRLPRAPKATPVVFASSELVLVSTGPAADNYQQLKRSYNDTQVVDKEACGFLKAMQGRGDTLSMVVRGVSDNVAGQLESDTHGSQPLAARNAAAFLFALLEECPPLLTRSLSGDHLLRWAVAPFRGREFSRE